MRIGYARCSTDGQDLQAQLDALDALGVEHEHIVTDRGWTGKNRQRPGLARALAQVRPGDTLVVAKLDRLGRSVPDLRAIAGELEANGVALQIGRDVHDPTSPTGKLFFNILGAFAEFEADVIGQRTRESLAAKRAALAAEGKRMRGRGPKLSTLQERKLCEARERGESIADLMATFGVGRATVYRALQRGQESAA